MSNGSSGVRQRVALAHDYLTTVGGAERVVLSMAHTFPDAPIYTSLYEPDLVAPELRHGLDIRPSSLNRWGPLRRNYRLALPLMAPTFDRVVVDADVVLVSSSGWAHGLRTAGRKIVYCHNPPRWVYQRRDYAPPGRPMWWAVALALHPYLVRWDKRAERTCHRYLANSSIVAERIRQFYGREAEILPPPTAFEPTGEQEAVQGLDAGFFVTVGRLIGHKNVASVVEAFASVPDQRLVVVGDGPERERLATLASSNVHFTGTVDDAQLRWLYANSTALVSASREDFGLVPLEAAAFGKPSVLLRFGGFLDTMDEDRTAVFFDRPDPTEISVAIRRAVDAGWDRTEITANVERFSAPRFARRLREIVDEELSLSTE
jgi:glycosyltransferase involved in cell wall biosynthesis